MITLAIVTDIINQVLPEPHAGLLNGILFGVKATFDPRLKKFIAAIRHASYYRALRYEYFDFGDSCKPRTSPVYSTSYSKRGYGGYYYRFYMVCRALTECDPGRYHGHNQFISCVHG